MNDQLNVFLGSLMYVLMLIRIEGTKGYDWAIDARARVFLACSLGVITLTERERLLVLCGEARLHSGKPFPSEKNAGPCIPWFELHKREQAAAEAKPSVQATEPAAVEAESKPSVRNPAIACARHFVCGGCGKTAKSSKAHPGKVLCWRCRKSFSRLAISVKPQAQDSANEKPEPVPAPTSRRELRLLCVLGKPHLGTVETGYLPIHTMHRLPPRAMVKGKWSQPRYAGLYLRETQAVVPSATVLARCERHRQANAFRTPARTI